MPIKFLDETQTTTETLAPTAQGAPQQMPDVQVQPSSRIRFLDEEQPAPAAAQPMQRFEPPTYQRGTDPEVDKYLDDNQKQWEGIAAHIFTERELREIKAKGPIGYFESNYKNFAIPGWTTGWKTAETLDMANLSRKYANNTITQGEKDALFAFARKEAEEQIRGYTFMGKVGSGFAQAPAFMIEFAASLGVGKLAASAALKTAQKEVLEGVAEGVTKKVIQQTVAQKVAQTAVTHAAGATALIALEAPAAYGERRMNQYMTITDKGQALFTEAQEKPFTSALKAAGNVGIEYVSETSGAAIGGLLVKPVGKLISPYASKMGATLIDRVPVKVKDALFQSYKAIQPNAKVTEAFTAAGWNGMLEELGEERVGDVLRVALDLDGKEGYSFDQLMTALYPGAEQLLVEAGVIGMIGGGRVALNGAANGLHRIAVKKGMSEKDATEMVNNLSQSELDTMFSGLSAQELRTQIQQVEGAAFELARGQKIDEDEARQWAKIMAANSLWGAKNYGISPSAYFDRLQLDVQNYNGPPMTKGEMNAIMSLEPDPTGGMELPHQSTISTLREYQKNIDAANARTETAMNKASAESRKYKGKSKVSQTPILNYLKSKGGVLIGSDLASELGTMGVTSKTHPWLFRRKNSRVVTPQGVVEIPALQSLGTIDPKEINDKTGNSFVAVGTSSTDKDGYYADQRQILEAIDNEVRGIGKQEKSGTQSSDEWFDDMQRVLGMAGVSLDNTDEEINAALMQLKRDRMNQSIFDKEAQGKTPYTATTISVEGNVLEQKNRASIQFMQNGKKIISLLAGADRSSLLHETGHMFLRELEAAARTSDTASDHLKAVRDFVGAAEGQPFTREQEETFARGFERYLMEGTAPNNFLRDAFESFREWMIEIYENVTGLSVPMNNEARKVFDALLGGKDLDIYMKPVSIENHESAWAKFYRYVVDDLDPIHRAVKAAQEIKGKFPDGTNPEWLARLFAASKGRIIENIQNQTYYIDDKGNPVITGEGFKPILEDFDTEFAKLEPDYEARFNDLKEYLIARRYLEDLSQREDVEVTARQMEESAATIARIGAKYGDHALRFQDYATRIYEFQKRILENLVRSGLMSQEQFDGITKANQNYIPFQRVFEEHEIEESFFAIGGRGKFVSQSNPVKSIEGSTREVKDPFSQIIINTARVLSASERNRVSSGIAAMSAYLPDTVKPMKQPMKKIVLDDGSVTYRPDGVPKGLVIEYRTDGKRRFVEVSKPLYEALQGMHPSEAPAFLRIFQGIASFFRAAATLPPDFWIRNFIRDVNSASVQSARGIKPVDVIKGILSVAQKNDLYHEWMRSGGSFNSYMELDDKGAQQALEELLRPRGRAMRYVKSMGIEALKDASGAFEQATRIAMFARAKQSGESGVTAALQSRDGTLDFSRAGKWGRVANRYIPFLNAGIQGSDRLIRAFAEQPAVMTWRAFMTISVPSIVLTGYYLFGAPDDERKEYLEIPQWQKDMFWCFKANGTWWRIPKPFALGYAFGSLPERFMLWSYQGDKPEAEGIWREFVLGLGGSLSPIQDVGTLMTPVGRIVVESLSNYNFFSDRPIYPDWMDKLPPEERATKHQSETAMALGELTGQSPAIIENAIRGMLATTTPYIMGASDSLVNAAKEWNGETIPEKPMTPADTMFIRGFSVRDPEGYRSVSAANFFDKWQEIQQRHASFNKKKGDDRANYMEKHGNVIRAYKPMKGFYERMNSLQDRIDNIYDSEDMLGQDKVVEIRELEKQITDIARQANQWYISNVDPQE